MSSFEYPNRADLRVLDLPRATQAMRNELRRLGLPLSGDAPPNLDIEAKAQALKRWLDRGTEHPLPLGLHRWLAQIVAWMAQRGEWASVTRRLSSAISHGRIRPSDFQWWSLLARLPPDSGLHKAFYSQLATWGDARRNRYLPSSTLTLRAGTDLATAIAEDVMRKGCSILEVNEEYRLEATMPLARELECRLTAPPASPWLYSHSFKAMEQYMRANDGRPCVGRIGRALLEPLHRQGLGPGDFAPGRSLARIVRLVHRHLPRHKTQPAWKELGDKAKEILKWYAIQDTIEKLIQEWPAEKDRIAYWRGFARNARDFRYFKKAGVMAFRLDDYWFVEVGKTDFAAYVYPDRTWRQILQRLEEDEKPETFRKLRARGLRHTGALQNWYARFDDEIFALTGCRRDRRSR